MKENLQKGNLNCVEKQREREKTVRRDIRTERDCKIKE
jgi:hypothetical protein